MEEQNIKKETKLDCDALKWAIKDERARELGYKDYRDFYQHAYDKGLKKEKIDAINKK